MGRIRVGVSGWNYREWRGGFYPDGLARDDELAYAASKFDAIEINGTFYSLTSPDTCRRWRDAAPSDFSYAVKGSRFITHTKRLADARVPMANFLASGILELGNKLGPILWQLPPNMKLGKQRLDSFLEMLPATTSEAADMARDHDDRVGEAAYGDGGNHRLRHVLEYRHESFATETPAAIAKRHGVALCFSHSTSWPYVEQITAGFVYLRLHGPGELYASGYTESELETWADRVLAWRRGAEPDDAERISDLAAPSRKERDVYVFFDNTADGNAPSNALRMRELIDAG